MADTTADQPIPDKDHGHAHCGLIPRLAAAFYDGLLLLALWMLTAGLVVILQGGHGVPPGTWWFDALLFLVGLLFFGWFWSHTGQTLGMRAWRVRIERSDGHSGMDWPHALMRYFVAWPAWCLAGIGVFWCVVDPGKLAIHDRLSGTCLVREKKRR